MTAPDDLNQLDINDVAAVMERDPLSKALYELAQCKVIIAKQDARIRLLNDRIIELEARERETPAVVVVDHAGQDNGRKVETAADLAEHTKRAGERK